MTMAPELAIREMRRKLKNPYAFVDELEELQELHAARFKLENPYAYSEELDSPSEALKGGNHHTKTDAQRESADLRRPPQRRRKHASRLSRVAMEQIAKDMHRRIWTDRSLLFPTSYRPIDMLDPKVALEMLGYQVDTAGALGQLATTSGKTSHVAGLIDNVNRQVLVSSGLSPIVRTYTLAHELGHALMHEFAGMHRDKPLDGSTASNDPQEREAEIFASLFLMPERLVKAHFEVAFGNSPFVLDEETRFAMAGSIPRADWQPANRRELSRVLSRATRFNGVDIIPLATKFKVSIEAMAIRLEELNLVTLSR